MCGRYTLATTTADELRHRFPLGESVEVEQRFNVAPGDDVLVLAERRGELKARTLRWGLVPPWADDPRVGYKMINARAETVAEKPAYRDAFRRRRCLILADGFYEWQRAGRSKQPFHITRADGQPFAFAGLWTGWKDPSRDEDADDAWLRTCTIVTTQANERIHDIHPRMPVILDPRDEQDWVDPATSPEHALELLRPLPAEGTAARAVSKAVNDARYDGPECLADADPAPGGADSGEPSGQPGLF